MCVWWITSRTHTFCELPLSVKSIPTTKTWGSGRSVPFHTFQEPNGARCESPLKWVVTKHTGWCVSIKGEDGSFHWHAQTWKMPAALRSLFIIGPHTLNTSVSLWNLSVWEVLCYDKLHCCFGSTNLKRKHTVDVKIDKTSLWYLNQWDKCFRYHIVFKHWEYEMLWILFCLYSMKYLFWTFHHF